jgi:hypothetical protein
LSSCSFFANPIRIIDAKTAVAVDENIMPIKATDAFPKGVSKVACWLKWDSARINTQVLASWHYVTDDIHILDYSFNIPKKEGTGSLALAMPEGKTLPPGRYRVDLSCNKRILKTINFTVE